ncbi:hypothetical protein AB8613_14905 [Vibrio sp. BS-M-Sm-2]|uniref:hypothetical protein n=1 Tax=Vibrio sp. BS-M-Sm-2 TaxID=3241167 RepID=UPI003556691D
MKLKKIISISILMVVNFSVNALQLDKMIIVSDKNSNGILTLTNDEDDIIFVDSKVEEISISNGTEIKKKKYTRQNLEDWKISLTNQKLILKPGQEKVVGIRSLCSESKCENDKDLMFLTTFYPSPYLKEENDNSSIQVNFGFAPVYVIPTKNPEFSYELINQGDRLHVINDSNTLINIYANSCEGQNKQACQKMYTVLAGREKSFKLPSVMQSESINVTVTSHDRSYTEKYTLELRGM